ncbi:hypothetical protein CVT24_000696, partial [Panaeolus cyanescens]
MSRKYCPAIIAASSGIWDIVRPTVIDRDWTPGTPFPVSLDEVQAVFKRADPHLTIIIERISSGHFDRCPSAMWRVFCWLFVFADLFPCQEGPASFLNNFNAYRPKNINLDNLSTYYPRSSTSFDCLYEPQRPNKIRRPIAYMRASNGPARPSYSHSQAIATSSTNVPAMSAKLTAPASSSPSKRKASMKLSTASTSKQPEGRCHPYGSDVEEVPPFAFNKRKALHYDSEIEEIPPFIPNTN